MTPWTGRPPTPLTVGCSTRILERVACSPPGDLFDPGMERGSLTSPALPGGFLTSSATWEGLCRDSSEQEQGHVVQSCSDRREDRAQDGISTEVSMVRAEGPRLQGKPSGVGRGLRLPCVSGPGCCSWACLSTFPRDGLRWSPCVLWDTGQAGTPAVTAASQARQTPRPHRAPELERG